MALHESTLIDTPAGRRPLADLRAGAPVVSFDRHGHVFVGRTESIYMLQYLRSEMSDNSATSERELEVAGRVVRATPDQKWLAKFTSRDQALWVTYLMRRDDDYRVGWCQLFGAGGTNHLTLRARVERAHAVWVLGVHKTKADASLEESLIAARFGLPLVMFTESHPVGSPVPAVYTQQRLDRFFQDFRAELGDEVEARVQDCLARYGRDLRYPFTQMSVWARRGRTTNFCIESCNVLPELMSLAVRADAGRDARWDTVTAVRCGMRRCQGMRRVQASKHGYVIANGLVAAPS